MTEGEWMARRWRKVIANFGLAIMKGIEGDGKNEGERDRQRHNKKYISYSVAGVFFIE